MNPPRQTIAPHLFCRRFFCVIGGACGAAGIAAFAAGKHIGGFYSDFAPILLGNAPLFMAIAFSRAPARLPRLAGLLVFLGALLFTVSLLALQYSGHHLFPYSAPLGGIMMIIGWLLFIPAAFGLSKNSAEN